MTNDKQDFANDPAEYFGLDPFAAHEMPRKEQEELQLEALQQRFASLIGRITPLQILARFSDTKSIDRFEDAVPLFFPHGVYKSYPEEFLRRGRFDRMTRWLQRLVLDDLSHVAAGDYETIDGWLAALEQKTSVRVNHSSGTTGRMSFFPRGEAEFVATRKITRLNVRQWLNDRTATKADYDMPVIFLSQRHGRSGIMRSIDHIAALMRPPGALYTYCDDEVSADVQHFMARTRDAMRVGGQVGMEASAYVRDLMADSHAAYERVKAGELHLLELLLGPLRNERVHIMGPTVALHRFAKLGLERGESAVCRHKGARVAVFGGPKGNTIPDDWEADVQRFFGTPSIAHGYGMTELVGGFHMCDRRRFHCPPWIIPFVLDTETLRPKPRAGVQTGVAAYFDTVPQSHWGGIVSADKVEMSWDPCACGRTTPHVGEAISRIFDGSDEGLTASASPEAIEAVISELAGT